MNKIIFITGGARSGKSAFAESLALTFIEKKQNKKIAYLATAEITDKEMKARIALHQKRRGVDYITYEESLTIDKKIKSLMKTHDIIILECLTTWLGNIYHKKTADAYNFSLSILNNLFESFKNIKIKNKSCSVIKKIKLAEKKEFKNKLTALIKKKNNDKILIIISNEVNTGIVPENKLARDYRDLLGIINQLTADNADFVFVSFTGQLIRIK